MQEAKPDITVTVDEKEDVGWCTKTADQLSQSKYGALRMLKKPCTVSDKLRCHILMIFETPTHITRHPYQHHTADTPPDLQK